MELHAICMQTKKDAINIRRQKHYFKIVKSKILLIA